MNAAESSDTEVLVVGAAPVGLMVAAELARRGVRTRIIDLAEIRSGVLVDISGRFANTLGAVHGSVLLVRPDSYLAAHGVGFTTATISATAPALAPIQA